MGVVTSWFSELNDGTGIELTVGGIDGDIGGFLKQAAHVHTR